jgi:hypothetical protein
LQIVFGVDLFNFQLKQLYFITRTVLSRDCYILARPDLCQRCLMTYGCVVILFFDPFVRMYFHFGT